jgi:1,4-dihydroxy-2-naphthoyl-CoA hydrolase
MEQELALEQLQAFCKGSMIEHLGIEFTAQAPSFLQARMPVDARTHQPFGLLHGGASVVLAETLGSFAAQILVKDDTKMCVGLEINANHIRSIRSGYVLGTATPIHTGKNTQVWQIKVEEEGTNNLVCICRLTIMVVDKKAR